MVRPAVLGTNRGRCLSPELASLSSEAQCQRPAFARSIELVLPCSPFLGRTLCILALSRPRALTHCLLARRFRLFILRILWRNSVARGPERIVARAPGLFVSYSRPSKGPAYIERRFGRYVPWAVLAQRPPRDSYLSLHGRRSHLALRSPHLRR